MFQCSELREGHCEHHPDEGRGDLCERKHHHTTDRSASREHFVPFLFLPVHLGGNRNRYSCHVTQQLAETTEAHFYGKLNFAALCESDVCMPEQIPGILYLPPPQRERERNKQKRWEIFL